MPDVLTEIDNLKKEKNAVILAHYYCPPDVQALADYVGDSFYLAKVAKSTDADIIVFAGVRFMGESAKILNPDKKVLMPDMNADCPMAHMASAEKIRSVKEKYPDAAVVCYINSTAELKCMSDVCVTSANAGKIVNALPNKHIFFIPDENLGRYVAASLPDKEFIFNDGYCPIHADFELEELMKAKEEHPYAIVCSHPESRSCILENSDYIGSTSGIINYVTASNADEFIICTEIGIDYELTTKNPKKKFFYVGSKCVCKDMKFNTPQSILNVLKTEENEIIISDEIREKALKPLERMLELAV